MQYRVLRPLTRRIPAETKGERPRAQELAAGQTVDLDPDEAERLNAKTPQPVLEPMAGLKAERVQRTETEGLKAERVQLTEEEEPAKKPAVKKPRRKTTPRKNSGSRPPKE